MLWAVFCRPGACSGALEGVPSPDLAPRLWTAKATHMEWPPDFQATLTHHSISCSPADRPQTVLILAWRSPRPSESMRTCSAYESPGPSELTAVSGRARESQARRLLSRKLLSAFTGYCHRETLRLSAAGHCPPSRRGSKRHGDSQLWGGGEWHKSKCLK